MSIEDLTPVEIMALTLWGEARGERVEGQIAIANVIINRYMNNPNKYPSIKEVCLAPKQFSCWNESDPNRAKMLEISDNFLDSLANDNSLRQCRWIAQGAMNRMFIDNTNSALNYMTAQLFHSSKRPYWAKNPKKDPITIGNHVFFIV